MTPNIFANHDEWATAKRQAMNGASGGGIDSGVQHLLTVYNGPTMIENELKGSSESCILPRVTAIAGIQPELAVNDFAQGTPLFGLGFTSRNLWFNLQSNISRDEIRPPLSSNGQSVLEFVLAVAARNHVVPGQWVERGDEDALLAEFTGGAGRKPRDGGKLSAQEEAKFMFFSHTFDPDHMGTTTAEAASQLKEIDELNRTAAFERMKALQRGEPPAARYESDYEFTPNDDGTGVRLPVAMLRVGHDRLRIFEPDPDAKELMAEEVLKLARASAALPEDSGFKNIAGKGVGQLCRLSAVMQAIEVSATDVDDKLGENPLTSCDSIIEFMISVASGQDQDKDMSANIKEWAVGTELSARLPTQFYEQIETKSVERAVLLLESSHRAISSLLDEAAPKDCSGNAAGAAKDGAESITHAPGTGLQEGNVAATSRMQELVAATVRQRYVIAPVGEVLGSCNFRMRKSTKGSNAGPSELPLLGELQRVGAVAVLARGASINRKFYFQKTKYEVMTIDQRLILCKVLAQFKLTVDEYRANTVQGKFDVELETTGFPASAPGLVPSESPLMFSNIAAPASTQQREVTTSQASSQDSSEATQSSSNTVSKRQLMGDMQDGYGCENGSHKEDEEAGVQKKPRSSDLGNSTDA